MMGEDTILAYVCRKCGGMIAKDEAYTILNKTCLCMKCSDELTIKIGF